MADKSPTSEKFRIYGRLSFPKIDKPKPFQGQGDPRWEGTCLLDPADRQGLESIKLVIKQAAQVSKEAYGIVPIALRRLAAQFVPGAPAPGPTEKDDGIEVAFYAGDVKDYDGYAGMFVVPGHNKKLKPAIANRKGVAVEPGEPQYPYAGCYGWYSMTIWAQVGQTQKNYGKRIGTNFRGFQFAKDGAAFSENEVAPEDEFEALEDEVGTESPDDDLGF